MARRGAIARDPRPPANPRPNRDPNRMARYREAQDIIKGAAPGSPEYQQAADRLERIGKEYGLNWQQHIPATPPPPPPPVQEPPPSPYPTPEMAPPFEMQPVQPPPIPEAPPITDVPMPNQPETPIGELPPDQQPDRLMDLGGEVFENMAGNAAAFNPNTFQQQYNPQFEEAMKRAYDAVYNQFQMRNEDVFKQQNAEFAQMAAERGLDPNSEAYKTLSKQLADRQDRARQEAQNAALQASQQVQAQGFQQATDTAMMPGSIAQQFMQPALTGMQGFFDQRNLGQQQMFQGQQNALNRQFEAGQSNLQREFLGREQQLDRDLQQAMQQAQQGFMSQEALQRFRENVRLAKLDNRHRLQQIRATPRGGGGGGAPFAPFDAFMEQQILSGYGGQPSVNPINAGIAGFGQGIGAGLTNALLR